MIGRILVLLCGTACDDKAALAGVALAKRLGASVEGLAIKTDPSDLMFRLGEGVAATAIDSILEAADKASEEVAARARATLETAARAGGLDMLAQPGERSPSAAFQAVQGPAMDVLTAETGLADLVVFGEPGETAPIDLMAKIEHTLMGLRRLTLIARGNVAGTIGEKILLSFNGTFESCNALRRSMPIILKARAVEILHLCEDDENKGVAAKALRYIRQFGGQATIQEQRPSGNGIGPDIADRALATGADLIIMGAYGRSRLRELVLGGATRHMLLSGPLPVLLAH